MGWVPGVGVPSLLGTATNLKDGLVWLAVPFLLTGRGLTLVEIGSVAGVYPLIWAFGQPLFDPLSDRLGRRPLIALGMALQGASLLTLALATSLAWALAAAVILGLGTAMVYPTLIATSVADRVAESRRATALGIYRFFCDGGYALGTIIAGVGLVALAPTLAVIALVMLGFAIVAWWKL